MDSNILVWLKCASKTESSAHAAARDQGRAVCPSTLGQTSSQETSVFPGVAPKA
jgi:hypothetical protein